MTYNYKTSGVCSQQITFTVENGIVKNVSFVGGCPGNLQAVARLVDGMKIEDVIKKLKGIKCGPKSTSCPDQFATALQVVLKREAEAV
ncbi:TIGR03905 family TSCPD domain-containing protein [Abyssisolibacter fermentans]|uniref:TIGR03905 family TSCPD domain-containing protein n=1 Tax=Abyssisolibacter fermentans TaxID=1766203 RepID=UPI0008344FE7|nr:TIGR03905 family TSCPD domain-containing protein [Abyssisolibacter fermentans]